MRLKEYFFDNNHNSNNNNQSITNTSQTPFHTKSTWNLSANCDMALNTFFTAVKLSINKSNRIKPADNLTVDERNTIQEFKILLNNK